MAAPNVNERAAAHHYCAQAALTLAAAACAGEAEGMQNALPSILFLCLGSIWSWPAVASDPDSFTAAPSQIPYAPPAVRPFEPPSDFGREPPQGDAAARPFRRPIADAVLLGAYAGQYEAEPTAEEAQYAQGVAAAELSMDALAGPLDGRWTVVDASGRPLRRLVLTDAGPGRRVEGAWRAEAERAAGMTSSSRRDPDAADLLLDDGTTLGLVRDGSGWIGTLTDAGGRSHAVRLIR